MLLRYLLKMMGVFLSSFCAMAYASSGGNNSPMINLFFHTTQFIQAYKRNSIITSMINLIYWESEPVGNILMHTIKIFHVPIFYTMFPCTCQNFRPLHILHQQLCVCNHLNSNLIYCTRNTAYQVINTYKPQWGNISPYYHKTTLL